MILLLMGVSGSGKSLIGNMLSEQLHWPFADGDDFHPPQNKQKMAQGKPLDDADREPWLKNLNAMMRTHHAQKTNAIVACSALKKNYRDLLKSGMGDLGDGVKFVHLSVSRTELEKRLTQRANHFFNPALLVSQLATLESADAQENILQINAEQTPEKIVAQIREILHM